MLILKVRFWTPWARFTPSKIKNSFRIPHIIISQFLRPLFMILAYKPRIKKSMLRKAPNSRHSEGVLHQSSTNRNLVIAAISLWNPIILIRTGKNIRATTEKLFPHHGSSIAPTLRKRVKLSTKRDLVNTWVLCPPSKVPLSSRLLMKKRRANGCVSLRRREILISLKGAVSWATHFIRTT